MNGTTSFAQTYQDHRHAQKRSNAIIEAAATADAIYQAGRAMLAADGQVAGVRAFYSTLESLAADDTRTLARDTYDASLAESAQFRADQAAAAALAAEDADTSYGTEDADS